MKVGIAQINPIIGDFKYNKIKILEAYEKCVRNDADLVLTPELSLVGYSPMDMLFQGGFIEKNLKVLEEISKKVGSVPLFVGYVDYADREIGRMFRNAVAMLCNGKIEHKIWKALLPFYDIFDEARYYEPGNEFNPIIWKGHRLGITVCEDIWSGALSGRFWYGEYPVQNLIEKGAEIILNLSASPFRKNKFLRRQELLSDMAKKAKIPMIYCNTVGACDEVIFDGRSFACNARGEIIQTLSSFSEETCVVDTDMSGVKIESIPSLSPTESQEEIFSALKLGLSDYLKKCEFSSVCLGISGGIDSAVVGVLAKEVLGEENVHFLNLPGPYSSEETIRDAEIFAENLGVSLRTLSIKKIFSEEKICLQTLFPQCEDELILGNLQARTRGLLLMAYSNKTRSLLLNAGNKSEISVGYCTAYGDMCGALSIIGDLYKTQVYQLANWINRNEEIIPASILEREPTAELAKNQKDRDILPPYPILDAVLIDYLEDKLSIDEVAHKNSLNLGEVQKICAMIERSEWKRRQAPPVLRVSAKAFGIGRRMPIAKFHGE